MEDINDLVGTTIKKKYYVEKLIGKGGMGWVYLVKHKKLGNRWAMKVIKKKKTEGKLYKKEVEILEHINHPNIPQIIDKFSDTDNLYIVETYAQGISLSEKVKMIGKFNEDEAIDYFLQLSELLYYLHLNKPYPIIYRDLKPNNIIITHNNRLMLVDFGISKFHDNDEKNNTIIAGNRYYSPPEQLDFESKTDERSDIFALGMLILRLVTGKDTKKVEELIKDADISTELKEILEKCTYENPDDRYKNIEEVITDLKYLKDTSYKFYYTGRKVIYVDGANGSGRTFLTSQLAHILSENKISTIVLDLTNDIGISEYMNVSQEENISDLLEETKIEVIKRKAYKIGRYIKILKGEILEEEKIINLLEKLTKIAKVVLIDGKINLTGKLSRYIDNVILLTTQEEKSLNVNNKKIVEYLDNNIDSNIVSVVVNKYENTSISKYEILKNINLIPKLFKRKEVYKNVLSLNNVERKEFLKYSKKKQNMFQCNEKLKEDIKKIVETFYKLNISREIVKLKVGMF